MDRIEEDIFNRQRVAVLPVQLSAAFGLPYIDPIGGAVAGNRRMEKFGEWKHVVRVTSWEQDGKATWEVDVLVPGDYLVDLTYTGEGRLVWGVTVEGGAHIQNQQNASHNYQCFPIGWLHFPEPGWYQVSVSCLEGNARTASLKAIRFTPIP